MRKSVHTRAYKALCERLVAARRKAGLTQVQLAKILERPQSFVAKYERGERRIDAIELVEIAHALSIDPVRMLRSVIASLET
jgi:transcriptional regulator with XRE-family HTH domain